VAPFGLDACEGVVVSKILPPRAVQTAQVLRHVDVHPAPHTLVARGVKSAGAGSESASRSHLGANSGDRDGAQAWQLRGPQWQAGHLQGYAEGRQAGLEQAQQELRQHHVREGFDEGYQAGLAQARQQVEKEAAALQEKLQNALELASSKVREESAQTVRRFEQLIQHLPEQLAQRMAAMEDDVVALCFDIVCRILGEQLTTPAGVKALVSQATQNWPADSDLTIHLHPDDLQRLRATADDFGGSSSASMLDNLSADLERRVRPPLQWVADASLGMGGCVLRSSKGGLDARLTVQMNSLRDLLLDVRAQRRGARDPVDHALAPPISELFDQTQRSPASTNEVADQ
jgi:flagellar assembly protein FliH